MHFLFPKSSEFNRIVACSVVPVPPKKSKMTAFRLILPKLIRFLINLEGLGFTVVPFGQGFKDMSPPTKELMNLVLSKELRHNGQPVLRWMMDNVCVRTDPAGNIKMDKSKSTEKIDGAVATVMALDRAIRNKNGTSDSVYDSRGLLFI